jgi:aspartyl-tRNA(Asn)/glutamyl-tRNA(Gln) amidotransferase subunit B
VQKAIEYEINRQIDVLESGGVIEQETRTFDAVKGITLSMRTKEMAHDYRYFPEPDLLPVYVTNEKIEQIATTMPALPGQLFEKYTNQYQLPEYDTLIITENKAFALYFDRICQHTNHYKAAANWMIGPVKSYLNENALEPEDFPLSPETMAGLIDMVEKNVVSFSVAAQKIFPELLKNPSASPVQLARDLNLIQESDSGQIMEWAKQALEKYPEKIKEYQAGKKGLLGLFMGEVMKLSGGKADPKIANKILQELLNK